MGGGGNQPAGPAAAIGAISLTISETALVVEDAWQLTFNPFQYQVGRFRPQFGHVRAEAKQAMGYDGRL